MAATPKGVTSSVATKAFEHVNSDAADLLQSCGFEATCPLSVVSGGIYAGTESRRGSVRDAMISIWDANVELKIDDRVHVIRNAREAVALLKKYWPDKRSAS